MPPTAGRIHFVRKVSATGEIEILKELWKVFAPERAVCTGNARSAKKRIAGLSQALNAGSIAPGLCYEYEIDEAIKPLSQEYRRRIRCLE
ncbi:MAG: hypothetical protein IPM55_09265 [Acidobacteria bacterium]|nr:hypothetical protein [Acidobacteriota bacterium]